MNSGWLGDSWDRDSKQIFCMDFWSAPQEEVAVTSVAGDVSLPSVTIEDFPSSDVIVQRAIAIFKFRILENTSSAGVNALALIQYIQVRDDAPGTWRNAITLPDNLYTIAASTREGGDVIIGNIDISVEIVDLNNTYEFQWNEAVCDRNNLQFNDCQTGLRIYYAI